LGEEYISFSTSLCNLLHSPVTSSLLVPNILLNTMFSNIISFLPSRNISDQVSHPYNTKYIARKRNVISISSGFVARMRTGRDWTFGRKVQNLGGVRLEGEGGGGLKNS